MTTTTDSAVQQLLDKQAIHDTLVRYCRGADRKDAEMIASTYFPDAVDEHSRHKYSGRDVGQGICDLTASFTMSSHQIGNETIEFRGADTALCESYFTAWQTLPGDGEEILVFSLGRYLDRFERRDGEWKVVHRIVAVDHNQMIPATAIDPTRPHATTRDGNDPSYAFFAG